jgi:hypothetical protein
MEACIAATEGGRWGGREGGRAEGGVCEDEREGGKRQGKRGLGARHAIVQNTFEEKSAI